MGPLEQMFQMMGSFRPQQMGGPSQAMPTTPVMGQRFARGFTPPAPMAPPQQGAGLAGLFANKRPYPGAPVRPQPVVPTGSMMPGAR